MIYFLTVNYYCGDCIRELLDSLPAPEPVEYRVAIANNSPDDAQLDVCREPTVTILSSESNVGFGRACNLGLQWIWERDPQAIVWLVNPDACLLPQTRLQAVRDLFDCHPSLSILGTIVYTETDEVWFAGGKLEPQWGAIAEVPRVSAETAAPYVECDWISGCSLLLNLARFERCPQFDPVFFLYYEDVDFCQRYRQQGHRIAITAQFGLRHLPSSITNRNPRNKLNHSTYSYAIALERYAEPVARWSRMLRLCLVTLTLLPVRPMMALGKLEGLRRYFSRQAPIPPRQSVD